ncbi:MAG: Crp/Fnr family transcriptional regulator [Paracoccaceae bacterium]
MSLHQNLKVLSEMPLFRNIDPRRLRVIAMTGETLAFRAGERLFEKGDDGDAAYVVLRGEVDVLVPVPAGETSVAVLGPGQIVGEMAVLTDGIRSTAIAAKSDVEVMRFDRSVILSLLREFPDFSLEMIRVLARRLEATTARSV